MVECADFLCRAPASPKAPGEVCFFVRNSPEMSEAQSTSGNWWRNSLLDRIAELRQREGQVFLVLALLIGALTGLAVVAFILLTERMGMRLYPVGGAPDRK